MLFTDPAHALRERVLWGLLYDTAARVEEIATRNVENLGPEFRRARVAISSDIRRCDISSRPAAPPPNSGPRAAASTAARPTACAAQGAYS
ncbi:hypothetical protein [Nonomuraea sp. NPDC003201]